MSKVNAHPLHISADQLSTMNPRLTSNQQRTAVPRAVFQSGPCIHDPFSDDLPTIQFKAQQLQKNTDQGLKIPLPSVISLNEISDGEC